MRHKRTFASELLLAFVEFPLRLLLVGWMWQWLQGRIRMQNSVCSKRTFIGMALIPFWFVSTAQAAVRRAHEP